MSSPFGGKATLISRQMELCMITAFRNAIYRKGPQPRIIRFTSIRAHMTGQFRPDSMGEYLIWCVLWSAVTTYAYKSIFYDNWMKSNRIWFEYNRAYGNRNSQYEIAHVGWLDEFPWTQEASKDIDWEEYCVNRAPDEVP
eukprot:UN23690